MNVTPQTKERLKGLNLLIRDVLEKQVSVSSILENAGYTSEQIAKIRDERLGDFLDLVTLGLRCGTVRYKQGRFLSDLRELGYGYGRTPRLSEDELSMQLAVDHYRLTRLLNKSNRSIKPRGLENPLHEILCAAANQILGIHVAKMEPIIDRGESEEGEVEF